MSNFRSKKSRIEKNDADGTPSRIPGKIPGSNYPNIDEHEREEKEEEEEINEEKELDNIDTNAISRFETTEDDPFKIQGTVIGKDKDDEGSVTIELNVKEVLDLISSDAFSNITNRLARPTCDGPFVVQGNPDDDSEFEEERDEVGKRIEDLKNIAVSILKFIEKPVVGKLNFEAVSMAVPEDVWGLVGKYMTWTWNESYPYGCGSLHWFMDALLGLGKTVRRYVLVQMFSDSEWLRTWSRRDLFPKAQNLFFFSNSIWQPTNNVGNVINKQKKRSRRSGRDNVGNWSDVIDLTNSNTRDNYVFPTVSCPDTAFFPKSESSNSNFARVSEGLMSITQNEDVSLRSKYVCDTYFEIASVKMGKTLWEESHVYNSGSALKAWGISDDDDYPEVIAEKAGRKMFFNRSIKDQLDLYSSFIKSEWEKNPKEKDPKEKDPNYFTTHRVTYVVDRDSNVRSLENHQSLFVTKIKRPNSKTEISLYSPSTGKGVQIRNVKPVAELFPFV
jgi:hypothetical protein